MASGRSQGVKNVTPQPAQDSALAEKKEQALQVARSDPWMADVVAGLNKPDREQQLLTLLGSHGAVERFKVVALHSIVHDDKLRPCDPLSIVEAIREAAVLGLEIYGPLGESWVLPAGQVARLQIGYRGYIKLMRESEQIDFIDSQVVYMNDQFAVELGSAPRIVHVPLLFGEKNDNGDLLAERGGYRGAYAWLQLRGTPHPMIEWMPLPDIEQVRKASPSVKAGRRSPWDDWYAEMMRKSPMRRLAKRAPLSKRAQDALVYETETDELEAKVYAPITQAPTARSAAVAALPERFRPEGATEALQATRTDEGAEDPRTVENGPQGTSEAAVGDPAEDIGDEEMERLLRDVGGEG
jgi:recombination protein RecT